MHMSTLISTFRSLSMFPGAHTCTNSLLEFRSTKSKSTQRKNAGERSATVGDQTPIELNPDDGIRGCKTCISLLQSIPGTYLAQAVSALERFPSLLQLLQLLLLLDAREVGGSRRLHGRMRMPDD